MAVERHLSIGFKQVVRVGCQTAYLTGTGRANTIPTCGVWY